jgi:hypothetical protein
MLCGAFKLCSPRSSRQQPGALFWYFFFFNGREAALIAKHFFIETAMSHQLGISHSDVCIHPDYGASISGYALLSTICRVPRLTCILIIGIENLASLPWPIAQVSILAVRGYAHTPRYTHHHA